MPRWAMSPRSDSRQGPGFQSRAIFLPTSLYAAIQIFMLSSALLFEVYGLDQLADSDTNRKTCLGTESVLTPGDGRSHCSQGLQVRAGTAAGPTGPELQQRGFLRLQEMRLSPTSLYYTLVAEDRQTGLTLELLKKVMSNLAFCIGHKAARSLLKSSPSRLVAISAERVLGSHESHSLGLQ